MSIKSLLLKQYELHPKMQIQDMVKLIYQNEFAGTAINDCRKSTILWGGAL